MKNSNVLFLFSLILTIFLIPKVAIAQDSDSWRLAILEAIIGKLPDACYYAFDETCLKCFAISKIFPLILFTAILFLVFSIMMHHVIGKGSDSIKLPQKEERIVFLLSLGFSLLFLHSANIANNLNAITVWGGFFLLIGIFLAGGIASSNMLTFIIFIVALVLYIMYVYPVITGVMDYYIQTCV